jgi:NADH-quinone oxidoreductase subunit L
VEHAEEDYTLMYVSAAISILGIALAWWMYAKRREVPRRIAEEWPEVHSLIHNKYYLDEWNDATVVQPLWQSGRAAFATDRFAVDGILSLITMVPRGLGALARTLQDGLMQSYGVTMTATLLLIVLIVMLAG